DRRRQRLLTQAFHDLNDIRSTFRDWFDIDVCAGLKEAECRDAELKFYRRHVYEHNGGEVDQKYLEKSGDTTVRLKQHLHETQQDTHDFLSSLVKMEKKIQNDLKEILPQIPEPIKSFEEKKGRMASYSK